MPAVNVIDSIAITKENDKTKVLAKWSAIDPDITVYSELMAGYAAKLYLNWSDKNGTMTLRPGDYFTFVIPDIFNYIYIHNVRDVEITDEFGELVATYSIDDNNNNMKEIKVTFADYVKTYTNVSGDLWILLFVGQVSSIEEKSLEFIVNGELMANGKVTINPRATLNPNDNKVGYSLPTRSAGGYYIFEWLVYINMGKNTANGFNILENFSFEDSLPANSPHIFLTEEIRQELGLSPTTYQAQIGEYLGADSYSPEDRYQIFHYHFNCIDENIWYNYIKNWGSLVNGHTTIGIDGNDGLNVSDVKIADKLFTANLGTVTRPTAIRFFTIATVKLAESALGDSEVVRLFKNTFEGSSTKELPSSLSIYRFESGGSAQGITGPYNFSFIKVDEKGAFLSGAMFSLYTMENYEAGLADRFVYSDDDGVVTFTKLPEGIYYLLEEVAPNDYILNNTIYKVVISSREIEIYYGDNFENKLSDNDNKIVNISKNQISKVTLLGTKKLTGRTLASGMFNFIVRNVNGGVVATGTNDATGSINFSELEFDTPGVYTFTIEEVSGSYSGMTYDVSKYTVTVKVTYNREGKLTAEAVYSDEGVVFNNRYADTPVTPCTCYAKATKCRKSIKGKKIWEDNNNEKGTRPDFVEIVLRRDGEVYRRLNVDAKGDGTFIFCCIPIGKNSLTKYNYQVDEINVPAGYTRRVEGNNVINTIIP